MELNELTIKQAQKGLREKKFSSLELVKLCLERIKKVDKKVKAFITVCEKEAMKRAGEADKKIREIREIGGIRELFEKYPLLGIPFSMKDVYSTKGIRTTAGSKVLEDYTPIYNATVHQELMDAGAILIGKTNCDAWGHGSSTENSDFGATHNPWDLERVPGGSSGGCAAALASDMTFLSIGEDTGGSIRLPASFCSIVGLKVTYGRVSRYGAIAYASSLDSVGPMAKTVEDCAIVLGVIAGKDNFDATTAFAPVPNYQKEISSFKIKGLKIGLPKEFFAKGIDSEVKKIVLKAAKKLGDLGAKIEEVSIPTTKYAIAAYYLVGLSETSSNLARYDGIRFGNKRAVFGDEAKRRIMLGTYSLSAGYYDQYYQKAQKVRTAIRKDFDKVFKKVDCLLSPVSPTPPFKLGEKIDDPLKMYLSDIFTVSVNSAGVPSLALPCGFSKEGLPVGMQLIGPRFSERLLLSVGKVYEDETQWYKRKPKL